MARPLRIEYPGALHHVTSRGNARQDIFLDATDRRRFLDTLGDVVGRFGWLCHAYCLMGNHYHLLVETPEPNLSRGMRQLNGVYTQRFNRRHRSVGHVFQGRYKAILVERQGYLLELSRYVVLNPVRAGVVRRPGDYAWSSYRATAGRADPPAFLTRDWLLGQFGQSLRDAQAGYRRFVSDGRAAPSPWEALKGQAVLGSQAFVDGLAPLLAGAERLGEVPQRQRRPGRLPLADIFAPAAGLAKAERNRLIAAAHLDAGYTLTEIGRHLGLHYSTISKIVAAMQADENSQSKT